MIGESVWTSPIDRFILKRDRSENGIVSMIAIEDTTWCLWEQLKKEIALHESNTEK